MDVRVMGHRRAPAMEHGGSADARAEMLGIGGDRDQRLGGRAEQQVVNHGLVLVSDRSDLGRQREDYVEIADRQQICLARRKPILCRRALTLWAMAVAARVVSDAAVAATLAALDVPAERGRAALLDRRHHSELSEAHMPGIGSAPVGPMMTEDVCDLQPRAAHGRRAKPRVAAAPRSMMRVGRAGWLRRGSWCWRRGCRAPWCRAWHDPGASGLRECRRLAREGGWRSCAAACVANALLDPRSLGAGADSATELAGR